MRNKYLDTGEEYDLDISDANGTVRAGGQARGSDASADLAGSLDEERQPKEAGGKRKGWLKGTKKLKNWAKSTLSNVRERIHERTDRPPHAQWQPPPWPDESLGCEGAEASHSSAGGSVAARQFSDAVWELPPQPPQPLAAGADRPSPRAQGPPVQSLYGQGWPGQEQGATSFGPLTAALREREAARASASGPSLPIRYGANTAAPTTLPASSSAAAAPARRAEPDTRLSAQPGWLGAAEGAAADRSSCEYAGIPPGPLAAAAPELPRPRFSPGPAGTGSRHDDGSPGHSSAGTAQGSPVTSASGAAGFALRLGELEQAGSEASLSGGEAEPEPDPGPEPGSSMGPEPELDVPLLREDEAGPSSRAVPASKSWLHQAARVGGKRAAHRQLQQVRMVQELSEHEGPVWALRFSADARLLASGGQDGVLRVWAVYWYPQCRAKLISPTSEYGGSQAGAAPSTAAVSPPSASAPSSTPVPPASGPSGALALAPFGSSGRPLLLSESPLLALPGHRGDVLDLSWSQCRLLLTASADQTARLWHIDLGTGGGGDGGGGDGSDDDGSGDGSGCPSGECLRSFVHPDFVTSCCFHPTDPRRIVTGCVDGKIRVWSVPDGSVLATATVPQDVITRVLFSADASRVLAGTLRGKARHYEYSAAAGNLEYLSQVDVKNTHGSGRKVTGLAHVPYTYGNDPLYVITSADSRIRLYVGYVQERKFKGHRHGNTQIAASLSPSCQHIVCGSDDGWVYVWETGLPPPSAAAAAGPAGAGAGAATSGASSKGIFAGAAGGGRGAVSAAFPLHSVGGGKVKESVYEAFQTPEQTITVAIFAPDVCRLGRGLEKPAGGAAGGGYLDGGAAASASPLLGALFVVAGFSGNIYVYENLRAQQQQQPATAPG